VKCLICSEEFEIPNANICGKCADILRADEEATMAMAQAEDEARQRYEDEDEARQRYEDEYNNFLS